MSVKSDIEIAREATMLPITEVAAKLGIPADALSPYGHTKAKLGASYIESMQDRPDGKLILVTAITPTPAGEGKNHDVSRTHRWAVPYRQEGDGVSA